MDRNDTELIQHTLEGDDDAFSIQVKNMENLVRMDAIASKLTD